MPVMMHCGVVAVATAEAYTVIHVALVSKIPAVTESVGGNDLVGAGCVHEGDCLAPTTLIEVARCTGIVPGIADVAATREAADMPRTIASRYEVSHKRLKPTGQAGCNRNGDAGSRLDGDETRPR